MEQKKLKLTRPIILGDGEITINELDFREPKAKDYRENGKPFHFDHDGNIIIDADKMARMIARLTGHPLSYIDELCAYDLELASFTVVGFSSDGAETQT